MRLKIAGVWAFGLFWCGIGASLLIPFRSVGSILIFVSLCATILSLIWLAHRQIKGKSN
jgi:uncharacterized membrane protein